MRSVADDLRNETRERLARLAAADRVEVALRLGDADLETFAHTRGLDRAAALRALQRGRQAGRRRSGCVESLLA